MDYQEIAKLADKVRRNVGKVIVPLAENVQVPGIVERVDGPIFFSESLPEGCLAVGTEAAHPFVADIDFIVNLPAYDGGIIRKFPGHFFHDTHAVFIVMGIV